MKGFTSKIFGAGSASHALKITEQSVPIHFALSSFRWHQDIRPSMKLIAVHDFLSCAGAWEQTFNASMADLPLINNAPRDPLEIYSVELRGHNYSEAALSALDAETYVSACVADVVRVQQDVLRSEAGLVGLGFGAMVSAGALLHAPSSFTSAVLFVNSVSDLYRIDPGHARYRSAISAANEAGSFGRLSDLLKSHGVSDDVDRALILSMADQLPAKTRLRVHKDLLALTTPMQLRGHEEAACDVPVTVFLPAAATVTSEEKAQFARNFPQGVLKELSGVPSLPASDPARSKLVLESLGVLEELQM